MDTFRDFAEDSITQLQNMNNALRPSGVYDCLENLRSAANMLGFRAFAMETCKWLHSLPAGSDPDMTALIRSLRRELRWAKEAWASVQHEYVGVDGAAAPAPRASASHARAAAVEHRLQSALAIPSCSAHFPSRSTRDSDPTCERRQLPLTRQS